MTYEQQLQLLLNLVSTEEKHPDYDRVCELAKNYRAYVTHKGIDEKIKQYKPRETDAQKKQRVDITNAIIKPIISSMRKVYYKVSRNNKVIKKLDLTDTAKLDIVHTLDSGFYGRNKGNSQGKSGVDNYLRTRFVRLSFIDPNAWLVAEWGSFAEGTLPKVNPFEVKAYEAVNFEYSDGELAYLLVRKDITFITGASKPTDKKPPKNKGYRYIMYGPEYTIVYTQADKVFLQTNPDQVPADSTVVEDADNGKTYIMQVFNHKLGMVPAFRIGYEEDDVTDGRTYVAPYDAAEPYLEKCIQAVSELDLTMCLHTFPQKLQYIQKCTGASREESCSNGKTLSGDTCKACNGSGYRFHKSTQDAITLPMPKDKEEMIKLDDLLVYKGPPIETIQFQKDYVDYLEVKCHTAVFNTTVFVQATIVKTATEKEMDMDSAHDALYPFAAKISELWEDITGVLVRVAGSDPAEVAIRHVFPGDLKLKTVSQLLNDLKTITDSGAPSFVKDIVCRDLAEQLYGGDQDEMLKYDVKRRFFPFNGKSPEEIITLLSMEFVPRFNKVLYGSFELIFVEIEKDTPTFWVMTFQKQWDIVGKKVNEIIAALDKGLADRFTVAGALNDTPNPVTGTQTGTATGGNATGVANKQQPAADSVPA